MYILGISAYYHDSAACLLYNGDIVAAVQEERFTRIKNDACFPGYSIKYCLEESGISLHQVDFVVFYEKPFIKFERLIETYLATAPTGLPSFLKAMPLWIKDKIFMKKHIIKELSQIDKRWVYKDDNLLFTDHHQAHAASAFFPSPFKNALVLTADGVGEWATTTVWRGSDNKLQLLREIRFPHSLGLFYSAFTYYLGFKVNSDEYKVMGLAPYGKPVFVPLILEKLIDLKSDGSFRLNMKYFNYCAGLTMTNKGFNKLFANAPRKANEPPDQFHMDIACSVQKVVEKVMLNIVAELEQSYPEKDLCMAGGVALNCVINGKIQAQTGFKNIWIQPAAGDAGGALGAAYFVYYQYLNNQRKAEQDLMKNALLGPAFTKEYIAEMLADRNLHYEIQDETEFNKTIARYLDEGKVVGYFKGRMEFGPRALGSRSILGDPRKADMQSVINQKIKFRESFRPFAPAILEEYAQQYYNLSCPSPYMLLVSSIKDRYRLPESDAVNKAGLELLKVKRSVLPAVTHVDYSARLQTVNKQLHPEFYNVIKAFFDLTGCPAVINTSFNVKDEPIVCTPQDALQCFMKSDMDVLAIEQIIITKKHMVKSLKQELTLKQIL
ncbi:carbamoyltransferase family protein [Mucilaginibacter aquaedulcis]|uniref:carbamoyltransferase family protein n=1 Tax=Mucilaginibacter aquaedulcis TaxID=1187081 RepID=UPI0025B4C46F|nr:carbamoyltransferase [Mucilaginibacter aquaedulcis]MDN3548683.1 carbamoyltransferase [Mucilaginibacter aquaedulcis]